ncbi:MAG: 2-thiouracil desulfurase family protein [Planctomycetota bacterium]
MILISACLLGVPCRYDGAARPLRSFPDELAGRALLPVCPEELGGLPTPRPPAEISDGDGETVLDGRARLVRADGTDVTAEFLRGAEAAVRLARRGGAGLAVLRAGSPACGAGSTHAGGKRVPGLGVAAAALRRAGLRLMELE